jgi:Dullard-like phosphatase family protein
VNSKLLVLDLDETLVFATQEQLAVPVSAKVGKYFVYDRPYVREFLAFCLKEFRVGVWTSSTEAYAGEIVEHLFGNESNLEFVWARSRCTLNFDHDERTHLHVKNLKKVKKIGFSLEEILVVDDTPQKWARQYGNLVRVSEFEGDSNDTELLDLIPYLEYLKSVPNVREVEKRGWRSQLGE